MSKLMFGNCLDKMEKLDTHSIDMLMCDLPYGLGVGTGKGQNNEWCDDLIHLPSLWSQLRRVCKKNAAMCFTAAQPYATTLISSNMKEFRYDIIWLKKYSVGFFNAKKMPLRAHEHLLVFYQKLPKYNPQKSIGRAYQPDGPNGDTAERYPFSWQFFDKDKEKVHSTQKPLELLEWMIRTYTDSGETVLDCTMGSGSTGVACKNTRRKFIGIEITKHMFDIAKGRINGT